MTEKEKNELIAKIIRDINDMIRYQIKMYVDKQAPEPYDTFSGAQSRFENNLRQLLKDK